MSSINANHPDQATKLRRLANDDANERLRAALLTIADQCETGDLSFNGMRERLAKINTIAMGAIHGEALRP